MTTKNANDYITLANALDALAKEIEQTAGTVIGSSVSVSAGPGVTGSIIGEQISVSAGAGASGNIIGKRVSVRVDGGTRATALGVAQEIREQAVAARANNVQPGIVRSVLAKAASLGNATLTAITRGGVEAALHHFGI